MRYVYIKKSQPGKYIEFDSQLKAEEYNNLSLLNTWEDYLDDKWVLLSSEQITFHKENPFASMGEVWNMELIQHSELNEAKQEMLNLIDEYDKSPNVNCFYMSDNPMWLTVEERQQLQSLIQAHEAMHRTEMTRWFNGIQFTYTLEQWKQMLFALELYAGDALNVTEMHKAIVNSMDDVEQIRNYVYDSGYPEKLHF